MRMSKIALKKLRRWSKYQNKITLFDAHRYLQSTVLTTLDYNTVDDLESVAIEMKNFLIRTCGYKMTREQKTIAGKAYAVFENSVPGIKSQQAMSRYIAVMTDFFNGNPK